MTQAAMDPETGTASEKPADVFNALDETLKTSGPSAAIDRLVDDLDARNDFRALLDALLLKARHDLGLPLIQTENFSDLPAGPRDAYEARYVAAIREVGGKVLKTGDIPAAWPYFRAIGEPEAVARALDAYCPVENDERLNPVIEVAFHQGAHPRRGFELILTHYGICSAISSFEQLPREEATRLACAEMLVRELHAQLTTNLRAEMAQRGQPLPGDGASIPDLIAGREWLFADDAYHIDASHLSSIVRISPLLNHPDTIALAAELAEYGHHLSNRHRYEGDPPFQDVYADHRIYLKALLGHEVDAAVAHFKRKLDPTQPDASDETAPEPLDLDDPVPAQVLVGLLVRLGRLDEAIDVAAEHLAGLPESALFCPGISQLCQRAGQPGRLAKIAREQGNLVHYVAAILQQSGACPGPKTF